MSQPLIHNSARVLEFDALRDLLRGYASSPLGHAKIAALAPSIDSAWIEEQQELTAEVREFRRVGGRFDFSGLLDVTTLVKKSRIAGAVLETTEIRDVVLVVDRAAEWREIAFHPPANMQTEWRRIRTLSESVPDFTEFLRSFRNKIQPDGTLEDRASPELARIRREIEKQRRVIQESLRGYLRRLAEGGAVQDELITIRGERFVIPVKIEQKRRVQGVVHGASSSGQTVFVEPLETIEQNNELVRLLDEELAEIHRILLEMTRRIGEQADAILASAEVLSELELQFAKARFAEDYNCVSVQLSGSAASRVGTAALASRPRGRSPERSRGGSRRSASAARLLLHNARHPLLERNLKLKGVAVIPISVELEGARRQLVITGPNTGGKTVTLKTVGLLALMAQSGIPVPADRAEMPVFDAVLADIGDYQSIEQNLSTFSAHVTNIDFISRTATRHSLVLLDELGSATDPEEGAALAVAIAGYFGRIGCMTVISTHHTSLKVYGANTAGVINASVGFNETTLQPTYELKMGVPGASAGINIAQRLGLNPGDHRCGAGAAGHASPRCRRISGQASRRTCARWKTSACACKRAKQDLEREKSTPGGRGQERAAGQDPRNGKETRERAARLRIPRARGGECRPGQGSGAESLERSREKNRQAAARISRTVRFHRSGARQRSRPGRSARAAASREARSSEGDTRQAEIHRPRGHGLAPSWMTLTLKWRWAR